MSKVKPDKKPRWNNFPISPETDAAINRLRELLADKDPLGQTPSKHRAVAIAVMEAIAKRERGR